MIKILNIFFLFSIVLFLFPRQVSAHFLATDGTIGAVLHVDPNDDPVAGSQASFFLTIKDKTNKFTPQKCDCTFEINENGDNIFSQPLFQNNSNPSSSNASVFFTFPQKDVYQVKVVGKPLGSNGFQPFTLTWYFRIDQQATSPQISTQHRSDFSSPIRYVALIGMVIIGSIFYTSNNKKNTHQKQRMREGEKKDDNEIISNKF